jgi:tRNA threonylcarbamoyladenosine biosynthesis protein TsaB
MSEAKPSRDPLTTLVIDTCLGACQAAVAHDGVVSAGRSELMQRGHLERIAGMVRDVMGAAGARFADLSRIAVTVGPGSFTGLRVGLAFAKGLRLATGAELVGLGTLEALAASAGGAGRAAGVIDARRGQVYVQAFEDGRPLMAPQAVSAADAAERLSRFGDMAMVGPGAGLLSDAGAVGRVIDIPAADLAALVRLAAAARPDADVRPLYLRAPDAKLAGA